MAFMAADLDREYLPLDPIGSSTLVLWCRESLLFVFWHQFSYMSELGMLDDNHAREEPCNVLISWELRC